MPGFVSWLLYKFIAPHSCRAVQQQSVHAEWAYVGTWNQCHITKINVLIAVLARFLSTCLIENSELHSHWLRWSDIARLSSFFWLTLSFPQFYAIWFVSVLHSNRMKLHCVALSYFVITPLQLHLCSGLLWWWSGTKRLQAGISLYFWKSIIDTESITGIWIWKKWGKDVLACACCCCAITWMHLYHTNSYLMAFCLPGLPCKCTFNW